MYWFGFADHGRRPPAREDAGPPGQYEEEEDEEEKAAVGDEINAMLVTLLPWGISILFHVGLVVLAIFVVWTTTRIEKEEVIIPIAKLSPTPGAPLTMKVTKKLEKNQEEASDNQERRGQTADPAGQYGQDQDVPDRCRWGRGGQGQPVRYRGAWGDASDDVRHRGQRPAVGLHHRRIGGR